MKKLLTGFALAIASVALMGAISVPTKRAPVVQAFTASGTYTPTSGMLFAKVTVCGAGGAGGGSPATGAGQVSGGSGGSAGGTAWRWLTASQIGSSQSVTVAGATAGVSGAAGGNGGSSSFGALVAASGGNGGTVGGPAASISVTSPTPGIGTTGDVLIGGDPGGYASASASASNFVMGKGGSSLFGGGGVPAALGTPGGAGTGHCAGGAGTIEGASGAAVTGGAGSSGYVVVEEFFQ